MTVSMLFISDQDKLLRALRSLLLAASVVFIGTQCVRAQSPMAGATPPPFPDTSTGRKEKDDDNYGSPEAEMRSKLIIKEEKKRYDEHVERAREVFQLASQVNKSFEASSTFSPDDQKKLERLEKLTKRIRNDAGGSDSNNDLDIKDIPPAMGDMVKRVADWANELKDLVEKTPRQVVSAAVIDQANRLIGLLQHIRGTR